MAHLLAPLAHWRVGHGQSKHRWRDRQWGEEAEGEGRCLWAGAIFPVCPDPCSRKAEKMRRFTLMWLKNEEKQVFTWKESFSSLSDLGLGEICWAGDNLNIREEPFDVGEGLSILEQFSMTFQFEEMGLTGLNMEHQTDETWPVLGSNFKGVKWGKASLTKFLIGIWSSMRLANNLI